MTKEEKCKELGLTNFDYALPKSWLDEMAKRGHENISNHFVWDYSVTSHGAPRPLDDYGLTILMLLALNF